MKKLLLLCSFLFAGYWAMAQCQASFSSSVNASTASFSNTSTTGNLVSYYWNFGDGNTSNQMNPSHTYSNGGAYAVCLTVIDSMQGCSDTYCDSVLVSGNGGGGGCNASISNLSFNGTDITATNSSTGGTNYEWFINDPNWNSTTLTTTNLNYTPSVSGTYYVCMFAYNNGMICDTTCSAITVQISGGGGGGSNCVASFNSTNQMNTWSFANTSSGGSSMSYYWTFGDGNSSSQTNPTHTYTNNGTYLVCLTAFSNIDSTCYDMYCDSVVVTNGTGGGGGGNCNASFYWFQDTTTSGLVWLINNSTGSSNLTYTWDFGDGTVVTGQYPTHTYANLGSYLVCLTISDSVCSDTYCDTVYMLNRSTGFTVNVINEASVGVEEVELASVTAVYPNPVQEQATVALNAVESGDVNLILIDAVGKVVYQETVFATPGENILQLNTQALQQGIYFLQLSSEALQLSHTEKILKR